MDAGIVVCPYLQEMLSQGTCWKEVMMVMMMCVGVIGERGFCCHHKGRRKRMIV